MAELAIFSAGQNTDVDAVLAPHIATLNIRNTFGGLCVRLVSKEDTEDNKKTFLKLE